MKAKLLPCLALSLSQLFSNSGHAAIIFPKAPEDGRQIAYEKVERVLQAFPHAFNGLKIRDLIITDAHKMYSVAPENVISGNLLSAARWGGWDYLFIHGTNAVFAVPENFSLKDGKTLKAGGVSQEGFAYPILKALRKAEALSQSKQQDYEPRYLSMGFSFSAVWLHGKTNDIIIPLTPGGGEWNAYQPYSESEIVGILKPIMKQTADAWAKLNITPISQPDHAIYTKAMMDYEKGHGGKCGSISFLGTNGPVQKVNSHVEILTLQGMSSECGVLNYRVKVTRGGLFDDVKKVDILKKLTGQLNDETQIPPLPRAHFER